MRALVTQAAVLAVALGLAACSESPAAVEPLPSPSLTSPSAASAPSVTCSPAATASYAPSASYGRGDPGADAIIQRRYVLVGVSGDTRLLASRDTLGDSTIKGFDIEVARLVGGEVARRLLGDPSKVKVKAITAAQRAGLLKSGAIDMVARAMTMSCDRWKGTRTTPPVAFSVSYFLAQQRILVPDGPGPKTLSDLAKAKSKVCAPLSSTSLATLQRTAGVVAVGVPIHSDCLALLQDGRVDAITGDDAILAGFAAQDPRVTIVGPSLEAEPYGLAFAPGNTALVQFANSVLTSPQGRQALAAAKAKWLPDVGSIPAPDTSRPLP